MPCHCVLFLHTVIRYRALHGQAPAYIRDLLQSFITNRFVRSSDRGLLVVPRSKAYNQRRPRLWLLNFGLNFDLRSVDTVGTFYKAAKNPICSDLPLHILCPVFTVYVYMYVYIWPM